MGDFRFGCGFLQSAVKHRPTSVGKTGLREIYFVDLRFNLKGRIKQIVCPAWLHIFGEGLQIVGVQSQISERFAVLDKVGKSEYLVACGKGGNIVQQILTPGNSFDKLFYKQEVFHRTFH